MKTTLGKILPYITLLPWPICFYLWIYLPQQAMHSPIPTKPTAIIIDQPYTTCSTFEVIATLPNPPTQSNIGHHHVQHRLTLTPNQLHAWLCHLKCHPKLEKMKLEFAPDYDAITLNLYLQPS